jgi:hypothetical protein
MVRRLIHSCVLFSTDNFGQPAGIGNFFLTSQQAEDASVTS